MNAYVREYRKIEDRTRRRDNFLLRYLPILLLLAAGIVAGKIYLQSVAIRWSHELIERNEAARDLELQNQELTRTIAALQTRSRVAREASERLGMIVPSEQDVVWLPVVEREPRPQQPAPVAASAWRPMAIVNGWLDALWQEEALALTSQ